MEQFSLVRAVVTAVSPAVMEGFNLVGWTAAIGGPLSGILIAVLALRGKSGENKVASTANHSEAVSRTWDDVRGLTVELRQFIAEEVENQVKPIREELIRERKSRREAFSAFRRYATDVFMWNIRGRAGEIPQLSLEWQNRLEIGYLTAYDELEDTIRVSDIDSPQGG